MARERAFVIVTPGLEPLAVDELRDLGVTTRMRVLHGGIEVDLTTRQLYAVHLWARIPTRVLVRLAVANASRFDKLQELIRSIDWDDFLRPGAPVSVRASCRESKLYHDGAVAERVIDALGNPVDDEIGQRVQVRIDRDQATVSIDATGEPLHWRGWRGAGHAAPLRATLAAAMLRAARYDGTRPLVDPMTGSGTIAIEAAGLAAHRPHHREFGFQRWPSFEPGTWASANAPTPTPTAGGDAATDGPAPIVAADRDAGAAEMAAEHATAAGVADLIDVQHAALRKQVWPDTPSIVVANPPYGHRLGDSDDLRDLYAALGTRVRDGGHRLCLLTSETRLARATGLPLEERFATTNGGLRVVCSVSPAVG